ncbi:MAG: nuclear transport factor 2 family protein [Salinivenus sp.]
MVHRVLLVAVLGAGLTAPAQAQPDPPASPSRSPADAVRATIDALFDGMRAGDSAAVRAVFHDDARLHTALGPADTSAVSATSVDAFAEAVGQPRDRVWDERIWDVEIRVDGPLASAWVPYVFYRGDERSHCGVNAVQLVRTDAGWRLLQLTDTRRPDCTVPPEVRK